MARQTARGHWLPGTQRPVAVYGWYWVIPSRHRFRLDMWEWDGGGWPIQGGNRAYDPHMWWPVPALPPDVPEPPELPKPDKPLIQRVAEGEITQAEGNRETKLRDKIVNLTCQVDYYKRLSDELRKVQDATIHVIGLARWEELKSMIYEVSGTK